MRRAGVLRRLIPALAVLFVWAGLTPGAKAQTALTCNATVEPPSLRAEGLTELVGDIVLSCTGGTPPATGQLPTADISVYLNTPVTSRLSSAVVTNGAETLLLIDDPAAAQQHPCLGTPGGSNCPQSGDGNGTEFKNGTAANIYQGAVSGSTVTFSGIPIDSPGTASVRTFRITNVRVNATAQAPAGPAWTPGQVIALISTSALAINNPQQTVAFVQTSMAFAVTPGNNGSGPSIPVPIQQCNSYSPSTTTASAILQYQESFPTAFKMRVWPQPQAVPGFIYNSESGFYNPALSAPYATAGLADSGTRLKAVFQNIPAGVNVWVSTGNIAPGVKYNQAQLTSSETGPFSAVAATDTSRFGDAYYGGIAPAVQLAVAGGSATAVWEVLGANGLATDTFFFGVWFTSTANVAGNSPAPGTGSVRGGYGATYPSTSGGAASGTLPIPRFVDTSTAHDVVTVSVCSIIVPLAVTNVSPMTAGEAGVSYTYGFTATGGMPPYTWSLGSASIPAPGLTLNANTGALNGVPTTAGTYSYIPQVLDYGGNAAAGPALSLTVIPEPAITSTSPLPGADAGSPYTFRFAATGGQGTYTWSAPSGTPAGLSLSSAGVLSGTPAAAGSALVTLQVTDGPGASKTGAFALTINPALAITSTSPLPQGEAGFSYAGFTFAASGGQSPYTWSASGLPGGLALNAATGALSGTPAASGTFNLTVQVKDGTTSPPAAVSKPFTLTIAPALAMTSTAPLPNGMVGAAYGGFTFVASGGQGKYTWSVASGSTQGLTLSSAGVLSGTPTAAGASNLGVQVKDGAGAAVQKTFVLTIAAALNITNTGPMLSRDVNTAYSYVFSATGGYPPYTWSLGASYPAPGLSLNTQTGVLSGTLASVGNFSYLPQVTDSAGYSYALPASRVLLLTVLAGPSITNTSPLPKGTVGSGYIFGFSATGGLPPYSFSYSAGTLPPGLSVDGGGWLRGTPTLAGDFLFSVQVRDAGGGLASGQFLVTIQMALLITTSSPLPTGVVGTLYRVQFQGQGGQPPYTWQLASGWRLPTGLGLSADGVLSGVPATAGSTMFGVQMRDTSGLTATQSFVLSITAAALTITSPTALPAGMVGVGYGTQLAATGGTNSYTWAVTKGTLPAGLTLSPAGAISGAPMVAGAFPFTIQVSDTGTPAQTASQVFTMMVAAKLTILTPALPSAAMNAGYAVLLSATGGAPPYTWTVTSGALPAGLSLSAAGVIGGTPTEAGTSNFTIQVTDHGAPTQTASRGFSITVNAAAPGLRITTSSLPAASGGTGYSATLAATGGTPPYVWGVTGTLPPGLTLDAASGTIAGTPTACGNFAFVIAANDAQKNTASQPLTLAVRMPPGPPMAIAGPDVAPQANQQPQFDIRLAETYPMDITGQLQLAFESTVGMDDPMICFTNGTRRLDFVIPANSPAPVLAPGDRTQILTGTTAGTIRISTAVYQAGGEDIQPAPPPMTIVIPEAPPVITAISATRTGSGFTVKVTGFATQRHVLRGRFQFGGTNVQTPELRLTLHTLFNTWYQDPQSNQYGTQFTLAQPFNIQGDAQTVTSVTVTLSSSAGDSGPATARF